MFRYFPLNNSYNELYAEIGKTIKQYYPIGISRESIEYKAHPGIKKIIDIQEKNLSRNKQFDKTWKDFLKKLRTESNKKIHNNSHITDLCFKGELILESYEDKSLQRTKKIIFTTSLIAPFFSIYGVDETAIIEPEDEYPISRSYRAVNVITESPYKEFETDFNYLLGKIEAQFTGYKFVPVRISLLHVQNFQAPYSNLDECKVHNALFNDYFDNTSVNFFRGEAYYGTGHTKNITVKMLPPPPIV